MSNKYIDKKFLCSYNLSKLKKNVTLLGSSKNELLKQLVKSLNNRNIKHSLELAIELHISGYFDNVLAKLTTFYFNEINLAQPSGIIYYSDFIQYYNDKYTFSFKKKSPLSCINDMKIRNFICFFIPLCCLSNQRKIPKLVKIGADDFDLKKKKKKLISKNLNMVRRYISDEDPKDIIIPLSEIVNLFASNNIDREQQIIYWLSWIYEYEIKYHNKSLLVKFRKIKDIDDKYSRDFIWIIWNILIKNVNSNFSKIMKHLFKIFKNKFTKTSKKSKSNIIIIAIFLCVNPIPKIKYPYTMNNETFKRCILESLNSNKYYHNMFTKVLLNH
jgi:hypothetical protein